MYVNAKMILVETAPEIRGVGIKESSGGDEFNLIYLIHCSNLCKCYNVLPLSTRIKKRTINK
jgi:hypothetical protein